LLRKSIVPSNKTLCTFAFFFVLVYYSPLEHLKLHTLNSNPHPDIILHLWWTHVSLYPIPLYIYIYINIYLLIINFPHETAIAMEKKEEFIKKKGASFTPFIFFIFGIVHCNTHFPLKVQFSKSPPSFIQQQLLLGRHRKITCLCTRMKMLRMWDISQEYM